MLDSSYNDFLAICLCIPRIPQSRRWVEAGRRLCPSAACPLRRRLISVITCITIKRWLYLKEGDEGDFVFQVSSAADCLAFMQGGCELKKVRPNSRVYCRFYTLDPDLSYLRWEPSKKDGDRARLDVSSIREVRTGKSTETFLHNGPLAEHLAEETAFSIIHGDEYQVPHYPKTCLTLKIHLQSSYSPTDTTSLSLCPHSLWTWSHCQQMWPTSG